MRIEVQRKSSRSGAAAIWSSVVSYPTTKPAGGGGGGSMSRTKTRELYRPPGMPRWPAPGPCGALVTHGTDGLTPPVACHDIAPGAQPTRPPRRAPAGTALTSEDGILVEISMI